MKKDILENRDLSFEDIDNKKGKTLSSEQIDFYNKEGYLRKFKAYEESEIASVREYFNQTLEDYKKLRPEANSYAINGFHTSCKGIYDIVMNPNILKVVQDITGPDFVCWGTHFFCKSPYDPKKVAWHQDASYWPYTPSRTVTVWLAIDDASVENSAMMFLPQTHNIGHMKWEKVDSPAVLDQEIVGIEQYGEPVHNELKAGEFSIHADMLAHGSEPNESSKRRCGLTIRYCPSYVKSTKKSWASNAIRCGGDQFSENWKFPDEPRGENLQAKVLAIGAN